MTEGEFDYSALAAPDRKFLRAAVSTLRRGMTRTVAETLTQAQTLLRARRRLNRKQWLPWLAVAELAPRTVYRLMRIGRDFGNLPAEVAARFTREALYALIEPWIPAELRAYCIEQAREGTSVTAAFVAESLAAFRNPVRVTLDLASHDPAPKLAEPDLVNGQDNWRRLLELKGENNTIHISAVTEPESRDRVVRVVVVTPDGQRRDVTCAGLEECVVALTGGPRMKQCKNPKCQAWKPLDAFSKLRGSRDGHNKYCRACESKRSWAHQQARARGAGKSNSPD